MNVTMNDVKKGVYVAVGLIVYEMFVKDFVNKIV